MSTPFDQAVQAIITGDAATLAQLLKTHPRLILERSPSPHQATLLHYVAANGVEPELQQSPKNAPAIARMLLEAGAHADAVAPVYGKPPCDTTICLTVTSIHPCLAGVQEDIVDVLIDHGANVNGIEDDGAPLGCAIMFGYKGAAERLVARGARVDNVIHAAGLNEVALLNEMLVNGTGVDTIIRRNDARAGRFSFPVARDADAIEVALIAAAMHNRLDALRFLLDHGVDVNVTPFCNQTALHFAATLGRCESVDELLARGADTSIVETQFNQTAAQWAQENGHRELARKIQRHAP